MMNVGGEGKEMLGKSAENKVLEQECDHEKL